MSTIDYLARLGATLQWEQTHCRILYKGYNAKFSQIDPAELRLKFNGAMAHAVEHYSKNAGASSVKFKARQIEEAAFAVVLHALFIYNMWRYTYPQHKNHPLAVSTEDLRHPQAHDQCWFYCEKEFGAGYVRYAAALTGMTEQEFELYQSGRLAFFNR